ncbi:Indoleamine 2,3-dioxygenase [Myxozyma melibiosi]|uniref:Indoleamine 2,3-dioxygenase n=1 Tax=Myxozyma melibiosi TaxID=54550 RepID=A0ABR1FFH9_9ASCO
MQLPIPSPEDYDISLSTGFVPSTLPLARIPDPYYSPWEAVASNVHFLIMARQIRPVVDSPAFPLLSVDRLRSTPERRRAYSILGFIAHAYIWAGPSACDHLPPQLAEPLIALADALEVPPLATYAGLCLWNHRPIFLPTPDHPHDPASLDLSSLATLHTFTGSTDESWFFLVSTVIEIRGAACIRYLLAAMRACRDDSPHDAVVALQLLAESIDSLIPILARLPEQCDPHTFYYRVRPFLAGSRNMAEAGLPHGVKYGNEPGYRQYSGGSNAQSSLIQALDIALGVQHRPTSDASSSPSSRSQSPTSAAPPSNNFIHDMRAYMPGPHRRFLEHLELCANIKDYVHAHKQSNSALTLAYDACLAVLRAFRDKHIQIVSRYIIVQAKSQPSASAKQLQLKQQQLQHQHQHQQQHQQTNKSGLANVILTEKKAARGTGGTALLPFLKQARDETGAPAAGSWAARLLRDDAFVVRRKMRDAMGLGEHLVDEGDKVVGLAGQWSVDDETGGICHW